MTTRKIGYGSSGTSTTEFVCKLYATKLITASDMDVSYSGLPSLLSINETTREFIEKRKKAYRYLWW